MEEEVVMRAIELVQTIEQAPEVLVQALLERLLLVGIDLIPEAVF